ncbi:MAG: DbpA RNA binding domain-containing protein [Gemmatimonadota bacterium]
MSSKTETSPGTVSQERLAKLGYTVLPEIVPAMETAVERGRHLALIAAEGSGKECVYGAAVARLEEADAAGARALILAPTREAALRIAAAVRAVTGDALPVLAARAEAPDELLDAEAGCLAGQASVLLPAVRAGRLSLAGVQLVVVDGVQTLEDLDEWPAVEAILDTVESGTQKIIVGDRWSEEFEQLLERQAPRAKRWPEEAFAEPASSDAGNPVYVGSAESLAGRLDLLESLASGVAAEGKRLAVVCTDPACVELVLERLASAGLGGRVGAGIEVAAAHETAGQTADEPSAQPDGDGSEAEAAHVVAFGAPVNLADLKTTLGSSPSRFAIVPPRHVRHMELLASRTGWTVQPLPDRQAKEPPGSLVRFRDRIRRRLESESSAADVLVLEPLLAEYGAVRVAAALSGLLRSSVEVAAAPVRPWPDVEAASGTAPSRKPSDESRGTRPSWARVYIGAGRRDDVKAGDLVGAITGETGIVGGQIGKIDIRGGFSLVDVDAQVLEQVVEGLDGVVIKGRTVAVRPDREMFA